MEIPLAYKKITAEILTRLAQDTRPLMRGFAARHPNTPPLVKAWLTSGYNKSMTLEEFLEAANEKV